jgi:hypothetical protein
VLVKVRQAKEIARRWVREASSSLPGFGGAFFHGSINWLADDVELAPSSDIDIMVVIDGELPEIKLGKFVYHEVLLDVSFVSGEEIATPESILGVSHLAGSFATLSLISDPTGRLAELQAVVARDYCRREWVGRRCHHASEKVHRFFEGLHPSAPFHDNAASWAFGTSVTTHILLIADLRNPTVRKRYLATRELLADYGHLEFYERLLAQLGCATMSAAEVAQHLAALAEVFDVAKTVITTPIFFASDLSDAAQPIAVDGSRELIERGLHRETVFWIVATFARCHKVLAVDASPDVQAHHEPAFRRLLADLGIASFPDFTRRAAEVKASLPDIWRVAESIMDANPEIVD